ncbi:MAG TPA: DUF4388 domain-containing protein [Thermoanaerobaculia bacterium]|nr:DUF4388 domain-containing protein [Thermoanaerobaculia bacterium]
MAIFGDFADLPFPETFSMVGRRTGRLLISDVPDQGSFELHLVDGSLRGLRIDHEDIDDPLRARDRLAALMEAPCGLFQFHRCAPERLHGALDLPLISLLMSLASAVDEISAYRERFLHPQARFRRLAGEAVRLADDLDQFAQKATPYLLQGTDAEELARALDISLDQVRLYLYKLRSLGWIAPIGATGDVEHDLPLPEIGCSSWDDAIDEFFRSLRGRLEAV